MPDTSDETKARTLRVQMVHCGFIYYHQPDWRYVWTAKGRSWVTEELRYAETTPEPGAFMSAMLERDLYTVKTIETHYMKGLNNDGSE